MHQKTKSDERHTESTVQDKRRRQFFVVGGEVGLTISPTDRFDLFSLSPDWSIGCLVFSFARWLHKEQRIPLVLATRRVRMCAHAQYLQKVVSGIKAESKSWTQLWSCFCGVEGRLTKAIHELDPRRYIWLISCVIETGTVHFGFEMQRGFVMQFGNTPYKKRTWSSEQHLQNFQQKSPKRRKKTRKLISVCRILVDQESHGLSERNKSSTEKWTSLFWTFCCWTNIAGLHEYETWNITWFLQQWISFCACWS